ncbi:DUF2157 domain-containing protein [Massilia sp. CF038]|uniref:DUF2157 domain-containing protein n=1 Tax=Massilia sp. CF038 TaxID=1881045 RepID=UPI00091D822E|nr:DUF2157 domain-containing protein [Massilia sp. CF038]SHH73563.1 Predicted membrane protein [Massilia sp. CF038]
MDPRPVLHELATRYALSPAATQQLHALAARPYEPANLRRILPLGIALLAAALAGLGVVFWVAANWDGLGRSSKFALLQSLLVLFCVAAMLAPRARVPLGLLAFLCIGGLFAFFGQTYQTGADAWQLFALWAALALPLCLGVRHDALWTPWALIVMTAVTLWLHAHIGFGWQRRAGTLPYHLAAWIASLLLASALSPLFARHTGAGIWSLRTALSCASVLLTASALDFLFDHPAIALPYCLALALLGAAAWAFSSARLHDTFALSALGLSINVMLVALLVRCLFDGGGGDRIPELIVTGIAAAALLATTVHLVLGQSKRQVQGEGA